MKTLNLVYPNKSDIKYTISKFPDGQQQVTIISKIGDWFDDKVWFYEELPIQIKARLNNFLDLELIVCATKALKNLEVEEIHLYTPYFLGSRSDRKFEEGGNNYLKDVICPIVNGLNFKSVTVFDPHSQSLECCLNNFVSIDNSELMRFAISDILQK